MLGCVVLGGEEVDDGHGEVELGDGLADHGVILGLPPGTVQVQSVDVHSMLHNEMITSGALVNFSFSMGST